MKNVLLALYLLLSIGISCHKGDDQPTFEKSPGTFTATIDGVNWAPINYSAVYSPQLKKLTLLASDNFHQLIAGFQLDSSAPLKNYSLESQGSNVAEITGSNEPFRTDPNISDAGGIFQLTRFDTLANKVSGVLSFTAYSSDRSKRLVFSSKTISDIILTRDTATYDGSYAACTINGATATNWQTKDIGSWISCISNGVDKTITVELPSVIGGYTSRRRYLQFKVPLNLRAGTYPIQPDYPPYSNCGRLDITCHYRFNKDDHYYNPTSGSFVITGIDTVARRLTANFTVNLKDTARQETIRITNGQLKLNYWYGP